MDTTLISQSAQRGGELRSSAVLSTGCLKQSSDPPCPTSCGHLRSTGRSARVRIGWFRNPLAIGKSNIGETLPPTWNCTKPRFQAESSRSTGVCDTMDLHVRRERTPRGSFWRLSERSPLRLPRRIWSHLGFIEVF